MQGSTSLAPNHAEPRGITNNSEWLQISIRPLIQTNFADSKGNYCSGATEGMVCRPHKELTKRWSHQRNNRSSTSFSSFPNTKGVTNTFTMGEDVQSHCGPQKTQCQHIHASQKISIGNCSRNLLLTLSKNDSIQARSRSGILSRHYLEVSNLDIRVRFYGAQVSIRLLTFWAQFSSTDFYQVDENYCKLFAQKRRDLDILFRRLAILPVSSELGETQDHSACEYNDKLRLDAIWHKVCSVGTGSLGSFGLVMEFEDGKYLYLHQEENGYIESYFTNSQSSMGKGQDTIQVSWENSISQQYLSPSRNLTCIKCTLIFNVYCFYSLICT